MDLNIEDYELLQIDNVHIVDSPKEETLYDITVEGDHTFFVHLPGTEDEVLMHNCDGSHITAMLIGWFKKLAPNLFNEGKICKLITPLILVKDNKGNIQQFFFNVPDFKVWEAKQKTHNYKITYAKGLGSWERDELIGIFDKYGLDKFILEYKLDAEGNIYIDDWLGSNAEKRKKYLREYTLDINQV